MGSNRYVFDDRKTKVGDVVLCIDGALLGGSNKNAVSDEIELCQNNKVKIHEFAACLVQKQMQK